MGAFDELPGGTASNASQSGPASFIPEGMPSITHADVLEGIAAGGYIRGIMVEAQEPDNRATRYALYILTSWQQGYHVFHIAWPSRPRLFKDLDRLMERCSASSSGSAASSASGWQESRSRRRVPGSAAGATVRNPGLWSPRGATLWRNAGGSQEAVR